MKKIIKHTLFYKLEEALHLEECPVCYMTARNVVRHIDYLFYENVNDPGVNKEIIASQGFCKRHSEMILQTRQSSGIAIIYKRIIDGLIKTNYGDSQGGCPICENEKRAYDRYCETFVNHWHEGISKAYDGPSVLCMTHFRQITKLMKSKECREMLQNMQTKKLEELSAELEEYSRKFDYRFASEQEGHEKGSWSRAVKLNEII
ncbi:MAG: DUF6062 family protein [Candidatus Margulisiibacteriota bacterium]